MMPPQALPFFLITSLAVNVILYVAYRRERNRRTLMCTCVGLPSKADWLPLYERIHRLVITVEGPEDY
jgi:hypothetical protein